MKCLVDVCFDEGRNWKVFCHRVERVKSFAPTIYHYVADVKVGPAVDESGLFTSEGSFMACPSSAVVKPSCALDPNGSLHQEWMM